MDQVQKAVERVLEKQIRSEIYIDDMQFGFMHGRGTTDAILSSDKCKRSTSERTRNCTLPLWIWKKPLTECQEKLFGGHYRN